MRKLGVLMIVQSQHDRGGRIVRRTNLHPRHIAFVHDRDNDRSPCTVACTYELTIETFEKCVSGNGRFAKGERV